MFANPKSSTAVGIDFGTTNSALARIQDNRLSLGSFKSAQGITNSYRSILYFSEELAKSPLKPAVFSGPQAIEQYLEEYGSGRLMQSLKNFLPNTSFESTQVLRAKYTLEELIALILKGLRAQVEETAGPLGRRAIAGRPVRFAHCKDEKSESFALERLRKSFALAGFDEIEFEMEPIAAAYSYEKRLSNPENLLVADFGGGTSDFCIIQVGPGTENLETGQKILSIGGVGVAGDVFDSRLVKERVAPLLGKGGQYRSMGDKILDVPGWLFSKLSNWHELSFMRDRKTLSILQEVSTLALNPEPLCAFLDVIQENRGFELYRHVELSKRRLTDSPLINIDFSTGRLKVQQDISRPDFNEYIAEDLLGISAALEETLAQARLKADKIDRVFMTGGTAFVPAVRELFKNKFGAGKLAGGEELTSVAAGLAWIAHDRFGH